jgi:hypothetical protein
MNRIAERTHQLLTRHPAPALDLGEVVRLIEREDPLLARDEESVFRLIRSRPDLFRVLDPWRGAWRTLAEGMVVARGSAETTAGWGQQKRPWIVALPPSTEQVGTDQHPLVGRLRESLVWLARALDHDSVAALSRWSLLVREETELRERLLPDEGSRSPTKPA